VRYILDDYGYVEEVIFGGYIQCNNKGCTEYTGAIPVGFGSLEEWHENGNIRAYKIVDGNLVYDATKDAELQAIYEAEAENNRLVTVGELNYALSNLNIEASNKDELDGILPVRSESGDIIVLDDSSSYPMERLEITCNEDMEELKLYVSTSNLLPNEALSGTKDGIIYTIMGDKSINLSGNATDFVLNLCGSDTNTDPLFILKAGETYYIESSQSAITLNLYTHDGTDRILYYTGAGGTSIKPDVDTPITQAEISCTGEIDTIVYPRVSVGGSIDYEPCISNIVTIDLNGYIAEKGSVITIEDSVLTIDDKATNVMELPCTYYENTVIYTDKDTTLDIDYKKSGFEYVWRRGKGTLKLRNTADGYGSIRYIRIYNLLGGSEYTLQTSDGSDETEQYTIDLANYSGTVDIVIEEGKTYVHQNEEEVGMLDNIVAKTYSPTTYITVLEGSYNISCEYMLASDFSIYCTRVEKEASIQMLDDKIALEVKRASKVEGELLSSIELEAGKIEQIVVSVGADGKVTAASIIQAINGEKSEIKISADKIDISGTVFPTIRNEAGDCSITTLAQTSFGDGIEYTAAAIHNFIGSVVVSPNLNLYGLQIQNTSGDEIFRTADTFVKIGAAGMEVRLFGKVLVNGKEIGEGGAVVDTYTKEEIDTMIGDVESILNSLNSGEGIK